MDRTLKLKLFTELTVSVPEAGKAIADLSRNAAYEAAKSGKIGPVPVIEVGGKKRIPTAPIRRLLGLEGPEAA